MDFLPDGTSSSANGVAALDSLGFSTNSAIFPPSVFVASDKFPFFLEPGATAVFHPNALRARWHSLSRSFSRPAFFYIQGYLSFFLLWGCL